MLEESVVNFSHRWVTLGVSGFSCAGFGVVQMPWPLIAEARLPTAVEAWTLGSVGNQA